MLEMMSGLEKQQQLTVAHAAGTFRVEQLTLRPMSTANKGHVLLCKTEHTEAALRDADTGDLTDYGANCEDYYNVPDGWHLLRYVASDDSGYPPCWHVDYDYPWPANPISWVLDLGLPKDTENELREEG